MAKQTCYICNKKNEPVFREDCKKCSEYNPCTEDGKWCFFGAIVAEHDPLCAETVAPILESAAAPILRDMSTVTINLRDGMKVDVLREDIKNQIERELLSNLGISGVMYGA